MKRRISILVTSCLVAFVLSACSPSVQLDSSIVSQSSQESSAPVSFESMSELVMSDLPIRTVQPRDTSDDIRMVINNENPLFTFFPLGLSGDETTEGFLKKFWDFLPEDLRAYSAITLAFNYNQRSKDKQLEWAETVLKEADKDNIPCILQVEQCDSYQDRLWTVEELSALLSRHPSLKGYMMVELCCNDIEQKEIDNMKAVLTACQQNKAILIWQDCDRVPSNSDIYAKFLEDQELYELMSSHPENMIIVYKHNGYSWHFNTQSAAVGCWLSDVCGNWGSNVESWAWWEEGMGYYDDLGGLPHTGQQTWETLFYPPALGGIDTISDIVGGATVFSTEQLTLYITSNGKLEFTPSFYHVLYPLYQKMIADKIIPSKLQVKEQIRVAYQYTDDVFAPNAPPYEAPLFMDLYGASSQYYEAYAQYRVSKKWVPTTGRYYIVPKLLRQVDAASILPQAEILNSANVGELLGENGENKVTYFQSKYAEAYTGTATMYTINGRSYIFNSSENKITDSDVTASFQLQGSSTQISINLPAHSYIIMSEGAQGLHLELTNYRYDLRLFRDKKERLDMFYKAYLAGNRDDNEEDFRVTTFTLSGLHKAEDITLLGSNSASFSLIYHEASDTTTLYIRSNGVVHLDIGGL